jgi:hypothetical protein
MEYIQVFWIHDFENEPVELLSELDDSRMEKRKIEIFRNGSISYACNGFEVGNARLGEVTVPYLSELSSDPQFKANAITREYFEERWTSIVK